MRKHPNVEKLNTEKVVNVAALSGVSECSDFALEKYTEIDATWMGVNDK